ncbi:uncharacterized protein LOC105206635 isoform X2 [Solenopsis invicta]|uniref:uncharacterized protein LOC105206635 isoform X2 n=1 Tax=Solenopsis invicta TaxID=13686 RepID=UPI00193EAA62|nr:uncharacterized protein LOC105206635 isoform X2 [Solenopsis invicta]
MEVTISSNSPRWIRGVISLVRAKVAAAPGVTQSKDLFAPLQCSSNFYIFILYIILTTLQNRSRFKCSMYAASTNKNPNVLLRIMPRSFRSRDARIHAKVRITFQSWCRDLHRVESVLVVHCNAGFYAPEPGDLLRNGRMWWSRTCLLLVLIGLTGSEKNNEDDASSVFIEEAKNLFSQKSLDDMAQTFSESGKQKSSTDGVGQIISGLSNLIGGGENNQGFDMSMVGSLLSAFNPAKRSARGEDGKEESGIDWGSIVSMGSMFLQQNANSEMAMGLMPMLLDALGHGVNDVDGGHRDHSGHSWFLPPILENIHVAWEHFSNSELARALWKTSGLSTVIAQMMDKKGNILWEKILDSFEHPSIRRRWIKSLTNFLAEWMSHISDPANQQRYLTTAQFVGNSFLKSQGFPKSMMFDATKPAESLSRLTNGMAKRYLNMNIDSSVYVKPAVSYFQELVGLASEKGFIMSRINARELSNRLSDVINNDFIGPILKSYRAYKWATKVPQCASQILCTINEGSRQQEASGNIMDEIFARVRKTLLRAASFPAAWAVSNKLGTQFWPLYGAIMEHEGCITKYPADCTAFHEEEIRVTTTENIHSEL